MRTTRMIWPVLGGILLMTAITGAACTDGSDGGSGPTGSTTTTSIPDDQKPPLLRDSWTPEDLQHLAEIEVPNYADGEVNLTDAQLTRVLMSDPNPDGVTLTAKVRLAPCDPFTCWDLAQAPDGDHLTKLRSLLPPVHQRNPDLVFDHEPDELIGDFEAFTLYWRSFVPDENAYAIGYYVLYHDNLNLIEVTVAPSGAAEPADDETLEDQMPKDWAREVTTDVLAAFADEFNADG